MAGARNPDQSPSGDHEPPAVSASIDALATQLRAVVRAGIEHIDPAPPELLALACVQRAAQAHGYDQTDDGLALGLRDVLRHALESMGDGPYPQAARLLFGTQVDTRGRALAERRRIAADAFDRSPATFRRNYERRVVRGVAAELYRIETTPTVAGPTATEAAGAAGESAATLEHAPTEVAAEVASVGVGSLTGGRRRPLRARSACSVGGAGR